MALEHGLRKALKQTKDSGLYILELKLLRPNFFIHKKLGNHELLPGYYYYIGSAQKNLDKRVERHLANYKKKHWHIDFLTSNKDFLISDTFILKNFLKEGECKVVKQLEKRFVLNYPIKSFGNSDCNSCKSHLLFSENQISYSHFCSLYQSAVVFIPSSKDTF